MRSIRSFSKACILVASLLFFSCSSQSQKQQILCTKSSQPNIIFIMADDLGWAELQSYGNNFNETPYLTELAAEGRLFTSGLIEQSIFLQVKLLFRK